MCRVRKLQIPSDGKISSQSNLLLRDVERVVSSSLCGNSSAGYMGIVTYTLNKISCTIVIWLCFLVQCNHVTRAIKSCSFAPVFKISRIK